MMVCHARRSTTQMWVWRKHEKCAKRQLYPFAHTPVPNYGNFSRSCTLSGNCRENFGTHVTLLIQSLRVQGLSCCYFRFQKSRRQWQWRAEECDSPPRPLPACRGRRSETRTGRRPGPPLQISLPYSYTTTLLQYTVYCSSVTKPKKTQNSKPTPYTVQYFCMSRKATAVATQVCQKHCIQYTKYTVAQQYLLFHVMKEYRVYCALFKVEPAK